MDQNMQSTVSSVVLYGCEIWSLSLREEHKSKKRVLRRIFGCKKGEQEVGKIA
jgi:hypothetical protein